MGVDGRSCAHTTCPPPMESVGCWVTCTHDQGLKLKVDNPIFNLVPTNFMIAPNCQWRCERHLVTNKGEKQHESHLPPGKPLQTPHHTKGPTIQVDIDGTISTNMWEYDIYPLQRYWDLRNERSLGCPWHLWQKDQTCVTPPEEPHPHRGPISREHIDGSIGETRTSPRP